jgi:hypothetical protein
MGTKFAAVVGDGGRPKVSSHVHTCTDVRGGTRTPRTISSIPEQEERMGAIGQQWAAALATAIPIAAAGSGQAQ